MDKKEIFDRLSTLSERETEALYWYFVYGAKQDLISESMRKLPLRKEGYKDGRPSDSAARTLYEIALAAIRPSLSGSYVIEDVKNYLQETLGEDEPNWENWPFEQPESLSEPPQTLLVDEFFENISDNEDETILANELESEIPIPELEQSTEESVDDEVASDTNDEPTEILTGQNGFRLLSASVILFGILLAIFWRPFETRPEPTPTIEPITTNDEVIDEISRTNVINDESTDEPTPDIGAIISQTRTAEAPTPDATLTQIAFDDLVAKVATATQASAFATQTAQVTPTPTTTPTSTATSTPTPTLVSNSTGYSTDERVELFVVRAVNWTQKQGYTETQGVQ